jgi:poly(A) polymerase
LISGNDLIEIFGLNPGPVIGEILEVVREAQVDKVVIAREDALILVENYLKSMQAE